MQVGNFVLQTVQSIGCVMQSCGWIFARFSMHIYKAKTVEFKGIFLLMLNGFVMWIFQPIFQCLFWGATILREFSMEEPS